jgi:hypothetical protein
MPDLPVLLHLDQAHWSGPALNPGYQWLSDLNSQSNLVQSLNPPILLDSPDQYCPTDNRTMFYNILH